MMQKWSSPKTTEGLLNVVEDAGYDSWSNEDLIDSAREGPLKSFNFAPLSL